MMKLLRLFSYLLVALLVTPAFAQEHVSGDYTLRFNGTSLAIESIEDIENQFDSLIFSCDTAVTSPEVNYYTFSVDLGGAFARLSRVESDNGETAISFLEREGNTPLSASIVLLQSPETEEIQSVSLSVSAISPSGAHLSRNFDLQSSFFALRRRAIPVDLDQLRAEHSQVVEALGAGQDTVDTLNQQYEWLQGYRVHAICYAAQYAEKANLMKTFLDEQAVGNDLTFDYVEFANLVHSFENTSVGDWMQCLELEAWPRDVENCDLEACEGADL